MIVFISKRRSTPCDTDISHLDGAVRQAQPDALRHGGRGQLQPHAPVGVRQLVQIRNEDPQVAVLIVSSDLLHIGVGDEIRPAGFVPQIGFPQLFVTSRRADHLVVREGEQEVDGVFCHIRVHLRDRQLPLLTGLFRQRGPLAPGDDGRSKLGLLFH